MNTIYVAEGLLEALEHTRPNGCQRVLPQSVETAPRRKRGRSTAVFETSPGKASADNPDSILILLDPFSVEDGVDVRTRSGATVRSELFH